MGAGEQVMDPTEDFMWRINREAALSEWWRPLGDIAQPSSQKEAA